MKKSEIRRINQEVSARTKKVIPLAFVSTLLVVVPIAITLQAVSLSETAEDILLSFGAFGLIAPQYLAFSHLTRLTSGIELVCANCNSNVDRKLFPEINEFSRCPECESDLFAD